MLLSSCALFHRLSIPFLWFALLSLSSLFLFLFFSDKIIKIGGDPLTMTFPGRFVDIANELNVSLAAVSKIWKHYCKTGTLSPLKHRGRNPSHLSNGHLNSLKSSKDTNHLKLMRNYSTVCMTVAILPHGVTSTTTV